MAKKRKSSPGLPEAGASTEPNATNETRKLEVEVDFARLCKDAQIVVNIPGGQQASPPKQDRDPLWNTYKFLYFTSRPELDEAVKDYLRHLPSASFFRTSKPEWRVEELLAKLEPLTVRAKELSRTPRAKRFKDTELKPSEDPEFVPVSPPSPSQSRRPNYVFRVSKMQPPKLSLPKQLPPPKQPSRQKQTTIPRIMSSAAALPAPNVPFISTAAPNVLPPGVSFESATAAKTSFWSDVQGTQRTVETAATSFSEDHPTESTDYGSVISSEKVIDMLQHLEASQKSDHTEKASQTHALSMRGRSDRGSEFHCSIDTLTADEIQAHADIYHAEYFERRDTLMTEEEGDDEYQTRITAVNADIFNHEGPCKQRLNVGVAEPEETGLVQLMLPRQFRKLSFELQWEVKRVLQTGEISPEVLDAEWKPRNAESLSTLVSERKIAFQNPPKLGTKGGPMELWETLTRSAKLEWSTAKTGPLFTLVPQVQRKDTSCSLQRWLGTDQVLYVEIPDFAKPPADSNKTRGKNLDILPRFCDWIKEPQYFLGRTWNLFFLRPNKKNSSATSEIRASSNVATVIFVSPPDGKTISDVVQWWFPFDSNNHQPSRKAYMRLELALSRTVAIAELEPKDFAYRVQDQLATPHPDDRRFEDPALRHQFEEKYDRDTVMSDGCCRMSRWIAMKFAEAVGLETIPPVLQIRVAGSKGLWYIDDESDSVFAGKPPGRLIHLANSQVKVFRDSLEGCDKETLTVGVVKANPGGRPSILHMLFLPILIDRGVSLTAICELVSAQVTDELGGFIQALEAPGGLPIRQWLASRQDFFEARRRGNDIETLAGFPTSREERIIQMLEAGFDPKVNEFLAHEVKALARQIFDLKNRNFTILLPKSTTLWGVADPENCLEPGEVCINFGGRFDGQFFFLDKKEVLVARNPALAPWDIQKVRCVWKQQLARFPGMIFFSAKGTRPLANKLQGGDYDGDTFWVTWEEKLVADFQNAPAPLAPPPPETFGITKDRTLLSDHVQNPHSDRQWANWLGDLAMKRLSANMLGIVTLHHERLVYNGCPIGSEEAVNWVHCHDYLVDSDKAGYDYDVQAFEQYKKSRILPSHLRNLRKPTYHKITRHVPGIDSRTEGWKNIIGEGEITNNVIDVVFFKVAEPIIKSALARASIILSKTSRYDHELARFYKHTIESYLDAQRPAAVKEMHRLKDRLMEVKAEWTTNNNKYSWTTQIERLRNKYDAIQPANSTSDIVVEWLRRQGKGMTTWDMLKASALASIQPQSVQLLFGIAGREMCHLKVNEQPEPFRNVIETQYRALKVRKPKTVLSTVHTFDDAEEVEEAVVATGYY